jgi:zinc finger BED domain-containing protein 1 (E3 SUMO-protein ligase ZBED1)
MINRLLDLKESFSSLCERSLLSYDMKLTNEQWDALFEIKALLEPFMVVQKVLEGQKYLTASLVPYRIKKVRDGLEKVALHNRLPAIRDLATICSMMVQTGLTHIGVQVNQGQYSMSIKLSCNRNRKKGCPFPTLIASALDPRLKHLPFLDGVDKAKVWVAVLELMKEVQDKIIVPNDIPAAVIVAPVNPVNLRAHAGGVANNALLAMFDDLYDPNNEDEVAPPVPEPDIILDAAALIQITLYQTTTGQLMLDGPNGPRDISAFYTNPLHWCALNHKPFPHLSVLAKQFLCIPATSAPSERVFSAAGLTIAKTRASLHPDNASDLIFLHNSWSYAEKYDLQRKAAAVQI